MAEGQGASTSYEDPRASPLVIPHVRSECRDPPPRDDIAPFGAPHSWGLDAGLGTKYWVRSTRRCPHSLMSATVGGTRVARRAGSHVASSATPTRKSGTRTKVTGSAELTP